MMTFDEFKASYDGPLPQDMVHGPRIVQEEYDKYKANFNNSTTPSSSPSKLDTLSQMLSGGLGIFGTPMMQSMYGMGYGGGYSPYGGMYGGMYGGGYGMSPFMGFGGYSPYSSSFGGSPYGSRGLMGFGLGSYGMGYSPYGMGYGSMYSMMPYGLGGYIPQSYGSNSQSQGSAPV